MFGRILHRMILWELTKVFLMSLFGITGILLLAGIVAEASQQGLGPGQILAAIPLLIPSTLPYTIPATTLFAASVVYGRLAADNEILAIKAAGINILQVVKPGLFLGLVTSAATMVLYYNIIPYSHHLLRSMVLKDTEELLYSILRRQGVIAHSQMPYAMWVKGVDGKRLLFPLFKRRSVTTGLIDAVAQAKEADLRVDPNRELLLVDMRWGSATMEDGSHIYFAQKEWEVPLPKTIQNQQRARDMTWEEILKKRREWRAKLGEVEMEISLHTSRLLVDNFPQDPLLPQHISQLKDKHKSIQKEILFLDVELLMRPALSLGCLFFILVGCPVGIWFSRSDYLSSFITCFLPIVIFYYPLTLCGTQMAKEGRLNPILMVWSADILIASVGLVLFWRLLRN